MAKRAAILGLETALGAYLARLLDARGYALAGTGDTHLLETLGIADQVRVTAIPADAADGADEVYDLRYGDTVPVAAGRLCVAVDPADTRRRAALAAERAAGRFVATVLIWPHESRLGPGSTAVSRIVAATAAGVEPAAADLASATDCGWTAEYVDALWRLLQRPAGEVAVATGTLLSGSDAAAAAAAYFKRSAPPPVAAPPATAGDPARAAEALGWRAVTHGRDLVAVLCEGVAQVRA
ncbi:MAG: hypothetical protein JO290_02220 [Sphingomonadaceae bacterium]|nr:hypothetical protein [Sphingomonadaceae bacterium]